MKMTEEKIVLCEEELEAVAGGNLYVCEVFTHKSGVLCVSLKYKGKYEMGSRAIRATDFAKYKEAHPDDTFVDKAGKPFVLDL